MITVHVDVLGERKRAVTRRLRHAGALKEDSPSVFVSQPPVDVELQPTVGEEANMIDQLHLGFHRLAAKRAGRVHVDVRPLRRDGLPGDELLERVPELFHTCEMVVTKTNVRLSLQLSHRARSGEFGFERDKR